MAEQRYSQNGWPAYANTDRYTRFTAAGQGWWAANADVAVVFAEFINRFDREVEEVTQNVLDDWSYANRLVRGSATVVSNHGSATAIDINALQHPRGVPKTFTPTQRLTMHRIRDSITDNGGKPVLRLGMDYTTVVDDMHIEVNVNAARMKEAANKIRKRQAAALEEIVATLAQQRAMLIDLIKTEPLVRNKPLDKGVPEGKPWTLEGVLAAGDQKADLHGRALVRIEGKVDAIEGRVKSIEGKVDAILALLKPAP